MKDKKNAASGKWEKSYTWMLVANAVYLVVFYLITTYYS